MRLLVYTLPLTYLVSLTSYGTGELPLRDIRGWRQGPAESSEKLIAHIEADAEDIEGGCSTLLANDIVTRRVHVRAEEDVPANNFHPQETQVWPEITKLFKIHDGSIRAASVIRSAMCLSTKKRKPPSSYERESSPSSPTKKTKLMGVPTLPSSGKIRKQRTQ